MAITKVDKNKYRIFISDGFNVDGSRRRFSKTITTDLKGRDLKRFLMEEEFEFEDEIKSKDPKFLDLSKGSFKNYTTWWLEYKKDHDNIEETTVVFYKKMLNNRILKFIGHKTLDKLTNSDMLDLMKMIKESPAKSKTGFLSEKSIKHYNTLLNTMFNDAVTLKIINESPMENITVKAPRPVLKDNFYNFEELHQLLKLLPLAPIKHQLAVLLTVSLGFRIGELTALTWEDINLQNMRININKSNAYTHLTGSYLKDTKNEHSDRTIAFPNSLVNLFLEHKEDEKIRKELAGDSWINKDSQEKDFIFTQDNGKMMFVGSIPKWFRKFIKRHDLRHITFHGLRHTNSTILIGKGINLVSVSHNLGHAKTSTTTDFYAHHLESIETSMANIFDEIIVENQVVSEDGTKGGTNNDNLRLVK